MKLAVIGSGNIGKSIGVWASRAGYEVFFSSKNLQHAEEAARAAGGNSRSGNVFEAIKPADMILLAVPYKAVNEVISDAGSLLNGKILIDATNALTPDFSGLALGFTTSGAEEIRKLAPEAKVVKAFNTVFASVYGSQKPEINGSKVSVFYAGDDQDAKVKVADLISKMGFDAVDTGPLKSARTLEPLALLNIILGYSLGHGTNVGFTFLR